MSDLPLQYAEDIDPFLQILNLPGPKDTMLRSSTTILALDDKKGQHAWSLGQGALQLCSHSVLI